MLLFFTIGLLRLTPFERATASQYVGRLCCYGEVVLGYFRTSAKAGARWCKAVWLGKTTQSDTHIIATAQGLFLTRSVRRLVEQDRWNLDRCGEVTLCPWEHGFASLGGKLIVNKRVVPPQAVAPTSQAPNPGDELGSDPSTSNGDSSSEGGDDPGHPGEPGEAGTEEAPLMRSRQAGSHSDASMSPVRDPASWCPIRLCRLEQASQQPRRWHRVCQRTHVRQRRPG